MTKECDEFIRWAQDMGWDITLKPESEWHRDVGIPIRYPNLPASYTAFLSKVKQCITPGDKAWFICTDDYRGVSDTAFQWNEFELLSLEAAGPDQAWQADITSWWDHHLPIIMSVHDGYAFYALDLSDKRGAIVQGTEPEFEETVKVADTLEEFWRLIMTNAITL
jgi:hypothetical protein